MLIFSRRQRSKAARAATIAFLAILFFSFKLTYAAETAVMSLYQEAAQKIFSQGLEQRSAFKLLEQLTTQIGHRLAGSPNAAAALELTRQWMQDFGWDKVHLEPIVVQRWVRGEVEDLKIINSALEGTVPLIVCALGGSVGTDDSGVRAPVIEVKSYEELRALGEKVKGKIVFFNRPMDPSLINTFQAYGQAGEFRVRGASEAAKAGAKAVIVRSLTPETNDVPHTGLVSYEPGVPQIPAAAVSTLDAEFLSRLLKAEPEIVANLKLSCRSMTSVPSANVVGQLTGLEFPQEIVLLGAHLDSWDIGTGAHDDGAGCVQVVEALRLIKGLNLRPKRTIRIVLFMNEEFGATGGRDYARSEMRKEERHLVAFEADRGGFLPLGLGFSGDPEKIKKIQSYQPLFNLMGDFWIRPGGGGGDIAPLSEQGALMGGLIPDAQRYFDVHHSANDVLAAVNPRELELGAIALAIIAFVLAQEGI
jgi:hypothetical protein